MNAQNNFRWQIFVTVPGGVGSEVPVFVIVRHSHEQQTNYQTNSL